MERVRSLEEKSEEKKLLQKTRIENAARVRRMAANEKTKAAKKMQAAYERMRHMDVRTAVSPAREAQHGTAQTSSLVALLLPPCVLCTIVL